MIAAAKAADYAAQLAQLLPRGLAWPDDAGSTLRRLLDGLAGAFAGAHNRGLKLLEEADPRTTLELLAEWEAMVGEPDACSGPAEGLQRRRQRVIAKLTARGGQSRAFMLGVATALGYEAELFEYRPFVAGQSQAGAQALNGGATVRFTWRMAILGPRITWFRAGASQAGLDPLAALDRAADFECAIARAAPAHTTLIVGYTDPRLLEVGGVRLKIVGLDIRVG